MQLSYLREKINRIKEGNVNMKQFNGHTDTQILYSHKEKSLKTYLH